MNNKHFLPLPLHGDKVLCVKPKTEI